VSKRRRIERNGDARVPQAHDDDRIDPTPCARHRRIHMRLTPRPARVTANPGIRARAP
jgi:hypothetical protein